MVSNQYGRRVLDGLILLLMLSMVILVVSFRHATMTESDSLVEETKTPQPVSPIDVLSLGLATSLILPPPPGSSGGAAAQTPGTGPQVVWHWPRSPAQRATLYDFLQQCAVLELAAMQNGQVRRLDSAAQSLPMSTLVRVVEGPLTPSEQSQFRRSGLQGVPVRLFADAFDQKLVRQLQNLLGENFDNAKNLTGIYSLLAGHWYLTGLEIDGKPTPGSIRLDRVCVHSL